MSARFGVWMRSDAAAGWMVCPITGAQIRGTRARMRQYATDMAALTKHVRPRGQKIKAAFVCRSLGAAT